MPACPSCGKELPGEFPFCPFCGAALTDEAAPVREERKVITVLFCDLVGSTAQADQMDPEDVRAVLARYHSHVKDELERFGGTVEKFIGDAVVALFGAPKAHEDDPERAVRAALALRDWVADQPDLSLRIAVNTGEALVALGARPGEGEGMASGDVLNTAARMQSAAPVDGILVGEQTYRATERMIEYRAADAIEAKGKPEPVPVWEAVQARARFGVDLASPSNPLVGRERELAVLTGALERVCAEQTPQLVTLVGVPGIGKSRLVAELFHTADTREELITWRQGRSLPYGAGVSYWAFGEIVKAQAGVLESDQPEAVGQKLDEMVAALFDDERDVRWLGDHLRPLAGLEAATSSGDRGEVFAAWRRFVEALAERGPVVLVFEDLHWADEGILDLLDHFAERLSEVPVLLIGTARPELYARRPTWGGGKLNATAVSLAPLSDAETSQLIDRLISERLLTPEAQSRVLDRAGGNPLYAQEFVRMAADRIGDDRDLPETVQGIIAARLDALPEADKTLLQYASVIGGVFWAGAVASVGGLDRFDVEERLHGLERREFVRRERQSSVKGETEYVFRHALVREVAYGSIPRRERADHHGRAAVWIEGLGRPDDHADLLAHHYLAALELHRATSAGLGAVPPGAVDALRRAGDRAFALKAFPDAARLYEQAVDLGGERSGALLLQLGLCRRHTGDPHAREALEQARDAFVAAGEPDRAAEAETQLANHWWYAGNQAEAGAARTRAEALLEGERRETAATANALRVLTSAAMVAFDNERVLALGREALVLAERLGLNDTVANCLGLIGIARTHLGEVSEGLADLKRANDLATDLGLPSAGAISNNLAQTSWDVGGDRAATEAIHVAAVEQATYYGDTFNVRWHQAMLVGLSYDLGRWEEALERGDRFIAQCETSPHYLEPLAHQIRGLILLARGDLSDAWRSINRAIELSRGATDPQAMAVHLATFARAQFEADDRVASEEVGEIRALLEEGRFPYAARAALEVLAEPLGLRDDLYAFWTSQPDANASTIALKTLDGDLASAADILAEIHDVPREAYVRMHAARGLAEAGDRVGATEQAEKALAFFGSVDAQRYIALCESYLGG